MKKIMVLICIFFATGQLIGQEDDSGSSSFSVPELFPVSPTAASLYKHSKIPMNLSSGQANQLIPLYTIEQNGFTFPISLRYNYSGLILDEGPSRTGLGWTLAATGVVNREVRGIPDENPDGIYGVNSILGSVLEPYFTNNTPISVAYLGAMADGQYDTEPDVYHVSVGSISFSFKVDENNEAYLLSKQNYKVDFSLNQIIVTDDNGVEYFFGTTEISSSLGEFDDINGDFGNGHEYTSSWFLSQIKLRNSSSIFFSYTNKTQVTSYSFMGTAYINSPLISNQSPCSNSNWGGNQNYSKTVSNHRVLSNISFSSGNVNFQATDHDFYELYTGIKVKDKQNNIIYDYELIYDNIARDLLVAIDKNDEHYFDLEYYNINSIPDFVNNTTDIPTAMDWWGYYNGKINNTVITSVPERPNSPDKSPSMRHTLAGALKKITNPTGGQSTIYYEQNQILETNQSTNTGSTIIPAFNRRLSLRMQGDPQNAKLETFSYTFTEDTYATISHDVRTYAGAYVKLRMQAPGGATYGNYIDQSAYLRQQADLYSNFVVTDHPFYANYFVEDIGDGVDSANDMTWFDGNSGGPIKILAGTYNFTLETWGASAYGNSNIELEIKFYKDTDAAGNPNIVEEEIVIVGGLRVREIETCPTVDSSEGCTTRSFEYSDASDFGQGNYHYNTKVRKVCAVQNSNPLDGQGGGTQYIVYNLNRIIYNYKSFTNVNFNSGIPVFYHNVIEGIGRESVIESVQNNYDYINDLPPNINDDGGYIVTLANGSRPPHFINISHAHFTGGYEDNTFESPMIENNLHFPFTPKSKDLSMGRLEKTEIYRYEETGTPNAAYDIIMDNNKTYSQFRDLIDGNDVSLTPGYPKGLKVARKISFEGGTITIPQNEISDYFYFEEYGEANNRFLPANQITTEYTEAGNYTKEVSNVYYPNTQQKSVKTTESSGSILKSENTYLSNLGSTTIAEEMLIAQNRISNPVEVRNYVLASDVLNAPSELLSVQKTIYHDFGNDLILPQSILSAKGNNSLEERLTYHSYDTKGNPVEMSKTNGTRTYIVWGYNKTLPIATLQNASADSFTSAQNNAIIAAVDASNLDIDEVSEDNLRIALSALRNAFPEALVQTATFDPLVGVTSKSDVKDYDSFFEYDTLNRLKNVRDNDNNLLKSNEYHNKNNN